jgi:hypothetical protein
MNRLSALLALPLLALACAAPAAEDDASDDADLSVSTVTKLTINRSEGFIAPSPLESCMFRHNGSYDVDLVAQTVKGQGCVDGDKSVTVNRALTTAEASAIRTALRQVKIVPRPSSCPTDGPGSFLRVTRGTRETSYTDPHNACFGDAKAATSIDGVLASVEKLTTIVEHVLEGSLASVNAIGGETTGQVLQTEGGALELEFAPGSALASQFTDGRKAVVVGTRVDRPGVEIPIRKFLLVNDLLVCPASSAVINCMPPTETKACAFGNRFWIQNNCGGVSFLD